MTNDEWWTQAVEEFGIDAPIETPPAVQLDAVETSGADDGVKPVRRRRVVVEWLVIGFVAVAAALLLRSFVVQQFAVDGQSMLGTLHSGDRVIVNKLSYDLHDPRRGDIVVLKDVKDSLEERDLIKRVIGLPGETVEYRDCQLYIDGTRMTEPYLDSRLVTTEHCGDSQAAIEIAPSHVFVMGDNRAASLDSRTEAIGQVPYDHLIGRASVVVWPMSDWGWL